VKKQAKHSSTSGAAEDYQEMMRKSWEAFAAQMQQPFAAPGADEAQRSSSTRSASANITLDHAMAGLKSYGDWLQGAAASVASPQNDWREQMQRLFGGASQPFSHGFAGADPLAAKTFVEQWQAWLNGQQKAGASGPKTPGSADGGFGFSPGQNAQQQALADAVARHLEALQRYQALMQRSNVQAIEKMQARLSQLGAPGQQIESLKVLYDLWVDCAEEAYAEIALSDEFREAYGDMVNSQIRVRQLQQEQTDYLCQQLGIPTRSELSSLGERLHALRREMRQGSSAAPASHTDELDALRRDVAQLKEQLANSAKPSASAKRPVAQKTAAKTASRSAVKKSIVESSAKSSPKLPAKKTAANKTSVKKAATKNPAASSPAKPARAKPRTHR
jgi:hypothetical protein